MSASVTLEQTSAAILSRHRDIKYTFVNSEVLPRRMLRRVQVRASHWPETCSAFLSGGKSFQECMDVFFEELYAKNPNLSPAAVEYLSSEEYKARVGAERFRIETTEGPW
jgi:hypothetical protein